MKDRRIYNRQELAESTNKQMSGSERALSARYNLWLYNRPKEDCRQGSPDGPSSSGKEGERAKTREEHWQELEEIETSLLQVLNVLYKAAKIIRKPLRTLGDLPEKYREIKECQEGLAKVVEAYEIPDGNFEKFFESKEELIKGKEILIARELNNEEKVKFDQFKKRAKLLFNLFNVEKITIGLEAFTNNDLKAKFENILYKDIKLEMEYIKIKHNGMINLIEKNVWSKIKPSNEYSSFKELGQKLDQISMQMKQFDKGKSIDKDRLLKDLADMGREFSEKYKKLRERCQDPEIIKIYLQKGEKTLEYAEAKSAKRQERGMTRAVKQKSWESFYHSSIYELEPNSLKRNEFDELMKAGWIKGKESDFSVIVMEPKLPDHSQPFEGLLQPLIAYVNPKDGVLIHFRANRDVDSQWRKANFPEKFSQQWIEGVKKDLKIEKIPKDFFEPLQASDLSAFAYQLAGEKYKAEHNLPPAPLTELVAPRIIHPETITLLHELIEEMKEGESMIFKPGEKGFGLVSATAFGPRYPFMKVGFPDIIGDGILGHYEVFKILSDKISIKAIFKSEMSLTHSRL